MGDSGRMCRFDRSRLDVRAADRFPTRDGEVCVPGGVAAGVSCATGETGDTGERTAHPRVHEASGKTQDGEERGLLPHPSSTGKDTSVSAFDFQNKTIFTEGVFN